jgi:hypothetical protein
VRRNTGTVAGFTVAYPMGRGRGGRWQTFSSGANHSGRLVTAGGPPAHRRHARAFRARLSKHAHEVCDGVSNTLLHLLLQESVAESLGLEAELVIPSCLESAIVCTEFGSTNGFVMSRVTPKAADSGWFCGCGNQAHDHQSPNTLRRVSLYEAAVCKNPQIIPFLTLPPDTFVGFGGPCPVILRGETALAIRPGSYLHRKYVDRAA